MRRAASSPLYPAWVESAERDLAEARRAIAARDLDALGLVAEHSALKMHAVGLAARPPLLYWRGATIDCVHRVWELRADGVRGYVTIDAGPQVKVLCEPADAERIATALRDVPGVERVPHLCAGGRRRGARVIAATAPGKLFLTGEWAVLRGAPALVLAVDRLVRVELEVEEGDGPLAIESSAEGRTCAPATRRPTATRAR